MVGQIFEGITGRRPNTSPHPDIEELNIDLKVLPLKKVNNTFVSKERSKLTSINYKKILNDDWKDTYLRKKIDKILFIAYFQFSDRYMMTLMILFLAFIFNLTIGKKKRPFKTWLKCICLVNLKPIQLLKKV